MITETSMVSTACSVGEKQRSCATGTAEPHQPFLWGAFMQRGQCCGDHHCPLPAGAAVRQLPAHLAWLTTQQSHKIISEQNTASPIMQERV